MPCQSIESGKVESGSTSSFCRARSGPARPGAAESTRGRAGRAAAEPGGGAAATTGAFRTLAVVAAKGSVVGRTSRAGVDGDGGTFAMAAVVSRGTGGRSARIATSGFGAELAARATAGFV
jgi:hypothetical protein